MATLAVARLTYANGMRQPLTWLVAALGIALIALSYFFGMFSFEDSNRMRLLLTSGIATTALCGLFLGVVSIAQAVHDELTSRTALTLFAKPIARHSFLLGKTVGVIGVVMSIVLLLVVVHYGALYFAQQTGFDLSERHRHYHQPEDVGYMPWRAVFAAHVLGLAANAALICLAATLALKIPLAGTLIITFAAFVGAHLVAAAGWASVGVLPALHLLQIDDALRFSDVQVSLSYFLLCLAHALLYGGAWLAIGISVLRRQDIP